MKIYIVKSSAGMYDDYWVGNVKAFKTQQSAQEWVDSQVPYNEVATKELEKLVEDYDEALPQPEEWSEETDHLWEMYYDHKHEFYIKALEEMERKWGDSANFNLPDDFHGYHIEELEFEE